MSEHPRCPDCGTELPTGATAGLCPKCLLAGAMASSDAPGKKSPLAPTTPQPGGFVPPSVESLAARFPQLEIVGLLGHGGMGAVYKARQTKLDRFVALKIIRPESADDPAFAERFTREARTLARLSHPNIVAVHDFGELPGGLPAGSAAGSTLFYFLMEYVDGANLRELMQSGGLRPEQALAIVPQICDALQYAHDEGVVHRDIKPENILIDRRGRVKIADFGLAKLAAQAPENFTLTATHQVMGTPRYMAPEQMAGSRAVDHRADIYSLGVVFYEMLTGELPMGSFEPPSRKTDVDPRLDQVVLRALAREPERRYQRASEVRTDVESILRGEVAVSGTPSSDSRPEPERGQSAGEAIWEIAGILARGWLVYIVLTACIGGVLLARRTPILSERASDVPGGPASGFDPGLIVLGAAILVAGLACLATMLKHYRRRSGSRRGTFIGRSSETGAPSAANIVSRPASAASLPAWSAEPHGAISGPGASTVLERGLAGLVNQFRAPAANSATNPPAIFDTGVPRFSGKAIMGACWAAMILLAVLMFVPAWTVMPSEPGIASDTRPKVLRIVALLIGLPALTAPFGTTILGLVAISDIRHSRGRLIGLPLAFADAVLFPTLLLNAGALVAVYFLFEQGSPRELRVVAVAVAALGCVLVDVIVLRRCWCAASRPSGQDAGAEASAGASDNSAALSTQPPLAHVDFTIRDAGDFDNAATFHFSGLGYRLISQRPNEWVFERGKSSAALFETDIRRYATTLVIRTAPFEDRRLRVSCRWTVKTYGAMIFRRDVATLEAEGHLFRELLSPNEHQSAVSAKASSAALPPDQPADTTGETAAASLTSPFPDLDLRRIGMELKGPAGGLLVVALLSTAFWCINGAMIVWDRWTHARRYALPPAEVAGIIAVATILLLAVGVLIYGARHMRRLSGYEWCVGASILAMIPWSLAVLVGLPVGIWAFRLLRRQDVRDAFLAKAIDREQATRLSARRGGRDWVTLTREQVEDDDLPDVCVVCGAPTYERVNKEFSWAPDWAGFLCLFGLWPGLIAIALTGKSMRVACPLCPADRGHWSRLVWVSSVGWLIAVPLAALGYLVTLTFIDDGEAPLVGALIGAAVGLVLWLTPVIYLSSTRVSVKSMTDGRITLQRVSPTFAKAVSARRTHRSDLRQLSTAGQPFE